jgi:hypothetical protein
MHVAFLPVETAILLKLCRHLPRNHRHLSLIHAELQAQRTAIKTTMAAALAGKQAGLARSTTHSSSGTRDVKAHFCPVCFTAAIVANAPAIAAAAGGLAAAKVAMDSKGTQGQRCVKEQAASKASQPVVTKKELPPVTLSYEEW